MFGPQAERALDREATGGAVRAWPAEIEGRSHRQAASPKQVAEGFIEIAVVQMANAIKKISVARGYDVTRYTLQCFGGAGGQHACLVADALGMKSGCSSIRWPACSRPTAWAWPTRRDARAAVEAEAGRRRCEESRKQRWTHSPAEAVAELRGAGQCTGHRSST